MDIPDEAVEAAFDRVAMRIKVLPEGSPATARDLLHAALEAALPLMMHGVLVTLGEQGDIIGKQDARIKELEDGIRNAANADDPAEAYDALLALLNEGDK